MIPISNGWMRNSISYARITEIASAAQKHALQGNAGADLNDHSRDMAFGEKLYDYLFCGSVKREFMDYLYKMSHDRKVTGIRLRAKVSQSLGPAELIRNSAWNTVNREVRDAKLKLKELMSGNSLHFCRWSVEIEENNADYLILRNAAQRTAVGIPLQLPKSSLRPTLNDILTTSTPTFHRAADIQLRHLKPILQRQRLILGDKIYQVRCAKNNEPVILLSDESQQSKVLQKKLRNLWAIGNVKQRFIKLINTPMADTATEISTRHHETNLSEVRLLELEQLRKTADGIQIKFNKAVEHLHSRLNDEASLLCGELDRFERAADYTSTDNRDFLLFQAKIRFLEDTRRQANGMIKVIKDNLNSIYFLLFWHSKLEQLEPRLLMVTNEIFKLLRSRLDGRKMDHIKEFCLAQALFIRSFSSFDLANCYPPQPFSSTTYQERVDQLLSMANDLTCTWEQFITTTESFNR